MSLTQKNFVIPAVVYEIHVIRVVVGVGEGVRLKVWAYEHGFEMGVGLGVVVIGCV